MKLSLGSLLPAGGPSAPWGWNRSVPTRQTHTHRLNICQVESGPQLDVKYGTNKLSAWQVLHFPTLWKYIQACLFVCRVRDKFPCVWAASTNVAHVEQSDEVTGFHSECLCQVQMVEVILHRAKWSNFCLRAALLWIIKLATLTSWPHTFSH